MTWEDRRFLGSFILLSVVSGLTVGLGKIVATLYAMSLQASPFQIGLISAMESVGMVLVTVPAGFINARYGARGVYFVSSLGPLLINLAMPYSASWLALAAGRGAIGLCIPFRIVSMNSSFLERLPRFGAGKAGWYRASLTTGTAIIGPALAGQLTRSGDIRLLFIGVAACFGIMALFSLSFLPDRDGPAPGGEQAAGFWSELALLAGHPRVAESCLVEFANSATNSLFGTFVLLLAAGLPGLTAQDGIHVLLIQGVAVVTLLFLAGRIIARLSTRTAYATSAAAAACALLALSQAHGLALLGVGAVLLATGSAIVHLANVRMMVELPGGKSKVAGLYNLASMLGSSFGAIAGGAIARFVPLQTVFLLWLPLLLGFAIVVQMLHRRPATDHAPDHPGTPRPSLALTSQGETT